MWGAAVARVNMTGISGKGRGWETASEKHLCAVGYTCLLWGATNISMKKMPTNNIKILSLKLECMSNLKIRIW